MKAMRHYGFYCIMSSNLLLLLLLFLYSPARNQCIKHLCLLVRRKPDKTNSKVTDLSLEPDNEKINDRSLFSFRN